MALPLSAIPRGRRIGTRLSAWADTRLSDSDRPSAPGSVSPALRCLSPPCVKGSLRPTGLHPFGLSPAHCLPGSLIPQHRSGFDRSSRRLALTRGLPTTNVRRLPSLLVLLRPDGRPGPCPDTLRKGLRPLCHSPKRCPGRAPAERFVPHLRAGALRSPGIPLTRAADRAS